MDYSTVDLEDLIDTSCVHDLVLIYLRPTLTPPSSTEDSIKLDDKLTEVNPPPSMVSSLPNYFSIPSYVEVTKNKKVDETSITQI